jgi:hypothetical protein
MTYFKDFKPKHKVYITAVNMVILMTATLLYLTYTSANPDQEVTAGVVVFVVTCVLMFVVLLIMTKRFQWKYDQAKAHPS